MGKGTPDPKYLIPAVEGQVLNPKGYPPGQKNARTVVREFMDKPCDKLPVGSRVSRFQFLLWAVYESVFLFQKQVAFWKFQVIKEEKKLQEAEDRLEKFKKSDNADDNKRLVYLKLKVGARERELKTANKDFERVTRLFQEAAGKAAEHFQKASGQYITTQEVINNQPVIVTADKDDLAAAQKAIEDEL